MQFIQPGGNKLDIINEVLFMEQKHFYDFLIEIASIAKIGLLFSHDPYALSNYQQISQRANEMLEKFQAVDFAKNEFFTRDIYPTPNVSVRTVVFNAKGEVLLVQEAIDHAYSLPGGWCDLYDSPEEAARKECLQEAGANIQIKFLVGVFNRTPFKSPVSVPEYVIVFSAEVLETLSDHEYETINAAFFPIDELPILSKKVSRAEVLRMIYAAKNHEVIFD